MNERIRELAREAELPKIDGEWDYNDRNLLVKEDGEWRVAQPSEIISTMIQSERRLKKFAELIVRECIAICQDTDGEDNIDARSGRHDCAVEIREHFGVEL